MWAEQQKGLKQDNEADISEGDHADMPFIVERMKNITLLSLETVTEMCEDDCDKHLIIKETSFFLICRLPEAIGSSS